MVKPGWPTWLLGVPDFVRSKSPLMCTEDPELYHQGTTSEEAAAELCRGCPHLAECREYALRDARLSGTWGGWTEAQRRQERRRREAKVAAA